MEIPYWRELYAHRLDWAEEAYSGFLEGVDEALADGFRRQDEITVALYGPTQVGKTTLLLRLLGVSDELNVAQVLRGGRTAGQSATATAIRYGRSPDDCWYVGGPGSPPLSGEEAAGALAFMRAAMEAGSYTESNPVQVSIPRKHFTVGNPLQHVRVLDLPGFEAAHATSPEGLMVSRIAQKHLPMADLIVLVVTINDLGALKPARLVLDALKDWAAAPGRIRIVATHTVSGSSFRRWLSHNESPSKKEARDLLAKEIRTLGMPVPETLGPMLYPLEYGRSWEKLKVSAPDVYCRAEPLVTGLFTDLHEDVVRSATRHSRLRMAFMFHHFVQAKAQRQLAEFDRKIGLADRRQAAAGRLLKAGCLEIQTLGADMERVKERQSALAACVAQGMTWIPDAFRLAEPVPDAPSVQVLQGVVAKSDDVLATAWTEVDVRLGQLVPGITLGLRPRAGAFDPVRTLLAAYTVDRYFINHARDRQRVIAACGQAVQEMREAAGQRLRHEADALALRLAQDGQEKKRVLDYAMTRQRRLKDRWRTLRNLSRELVTARTAYGEKTREQVARARQFGAVLEEAFQRELGYRRRAVTAATDPARAFLQLCYVQLLYKDFDKLKDEPANA